MLYLLDVHTSLRQVCIERCLSRGAAGSGRADDNLQSLEKRLDTYSSSTMPIINHYAAQNLVKQFDAARSVDEVSSRLIRIRFV